MSSYKSKRSSCLPPYQQQKDSDDQLNEQINDKLGQLWAGMQNKKKQFIQQLTPSYNVSKRTDTNQSITADNSILQQQHQHSQNQHQQHLQQHQQYMSNTTDSDQLARLKEKLASQNSARKSQQAEIDRLKLTIAQLTNVKRPPLNSTMLNGESNLSLEHNEAERQLYQNQGRLINDESSIHCCNSFSNNHCGNFQTRVSESSPKKMQKKSNKSYMRPTRDQNKENCQNNSNSVKQKEKYNPLQDHKDYESLEDLSKERLIQIIQSTAQFREFAYYYDSHELSYLKRLQVQHRKNCQHDASREQKRLWAPTELVQNLKLLNRREKMGLSQSHIQEILSHMKYYYESNEEIKIRKIKEQFKNKLKKITREKDNSIPYDFVRLSNAMDRKSNQSKRKRTNTLKF